MTDNLLPAIIEDVKAKTVAQFQLKYTGWYLLGEPLAAEDSEISYQTEVISSNELRKLMSKTTGDRTVFSEKSPGKPSVNTHFAFEIRKKPTNAFAGWISIGRAVNNDIVLRFPTVSKLHARLEIETTAFGEPLGYSLVDNQSTGKTVLNGDTLSPGQSVTISIGDTILFGNIRCAIMDATLLWDTLR